jgi:drug/metabolite transporter (DMT)-like permease
MIQRIQSVWLLLAAACAALTFRLSFFSGNKTGADNMPVFEKLTASSDFLVLIFTSFLVGGCLVLIFLFKNRKQQLWLTIAAIVVAVANIILYFKEIKSFIPNQGNYDLTSILSFAIPVFLILAARGIWQDEMLVKSADRLR